MSHRVKVIVRTRPTDKFAHQSLQLGDDTRTINVFLAKKKRKDDVVNNQQENFTFKFDSVLHNASQEAVYQATTQDMVRAVLEGYNGTVMAYGQTGAGKTFTMSGGKDFRQRGLIPRCITGIFNDITNRPEQSFDVRVSYMEIYNERTHDLLAENPDAAPTDLIIQEDTRGGIMVKGLTLRPASQESEALSLLFEGSTNRALAQHQLNSSSTRSHCIFTIYVSCRSRVESEGHTTHSKLHCIDLAGSERLSKTNSEGQILKEAMYINKSLSFLEQVVIALSSSAREHVPYRQSKLTNIIKDSLGGNCKTVMIANVWGEESHMEETVATLRFAARMMRVQNDAIINVTVDPEAQIRRMAKEINELKAELQMQNQLHGKSHIMYSEEFTDDERYDLEKQVRDYVAGSIPDIEVKSLRQTRELFRVFKTIVENVEAEAAAKLSAANVADKQPAGGAKAKASGAAVSENLVGELEAGGGVGIGSATAAKPEASVEPRRKSATEASPAPAGTPTDMKLTVELPDRNHAFEDFKQTEGAEVHEMLRATQASLREKKHQLKEVSQVVNDCKAKIDELREVVERKHREREMMGDDDEVFDEEEFRALKALKEGKNKYRAAYEDMQVIKSGRDYDARLMEQVRSKMIIAFEKWYELTYGSGDAGAHADSPMHRGGGMPPIGRPGSMTAATPLAGSGSASSRGRRKPAADEDRLDDGERFDKIEMDRVISEDPDSAAYYNARKSAALAHKAATRKTPGGRKRVA